MQDKALKNVNVRFPLHLINFMEGKIRQLKKENLADATLDRSKFIRELVLREYRKDVSRQ